MIYISFFCSVMNICKNNNNNNAKKQNRLNFFEAKYDLVFFLWVWDKYSSYIKYIYIYYPAMLKNTMQFKIV